MINQRESKTLKTKRAIMEQYKEVFSWNKVVVPLYNRMKQMSDRGKKREIEAKRFLIFTKIL